MDTKYSPLDHGGLEAAERNDGMEVVPGSLLPSAPQQTKQEYGNYFMSDPNSGSTSASETEMGKPAYFQTAEGEVSHQMRQTREGRRYCGMRKAIFITVIVLLAFVVVVGAVLGGVLGTVLSKHKSENTAQALNDDDAKNNTSTPLQTIPKTGLASAIAADGSGRLLTYYQAPDGRVIENSYLDGRWTLEDHAMVDASVVTTAADGGSPLAAVAYQKDGNDYRQVFFITALGAIMTTYSTTTSNNVATLWSTPEPVIDDTAKPGSIALAACTGPGLQSIRVYYPRDDYINEAVYSFGNDSWYEGSWLEQADPMSGVACNVYNAQDSQFVNVYFRNEATSRLQQKWATFDETDFNDGAKAPLNQSVAAGSDIAVCSDEYETEYIFYQATSGVIMKTTAPPAQESYGEFEALGQGAAVGSKLAVSYFNSSASSTGSALTFQNAANETTMRLSQWSRSGASLLDVDVT